MKSHIIFFFLIFCISNASADTITMPQYNTGDTVTAANINNRFNLLTNQINGGLNNQNADTNEGFRFIEILSSTPTPGNQGRVVFDESTNTLNIDTGVSFLATALLANTQTFTAVNTFSGTLRASGTVNFTGATVSDGGSVSTVDINGGTLDGVQVGGTTATGELLVNNPSDAADGLGDQGTSGQVLESTGAGSNPAWVNNVGERQTQVTWSSASDSGDIALTAGKRYVLFLIISDVSTDLSLYMRFNNDSTASSYSWVNQEITHETSPTETLTGDNSDSEIELGDINDASSTSFYTLFIDNTRTNTLISVNGQGAVAEAGAGTKAHRDISGHFTDSSDITVVEFHASTGTMSGTLDFYELD